MSTGRQALRIAAVLCGVGTIAYGILGVLGSTSTRSLISAGEWFVGSWLLHDVLIAPVVIIIGALLTRLVPGWIRPYLQSGLIVTAALVVVALPMLSGRGYQPKNPSALPLDYGRGVLLAITVTWAVVALVAAGSWIVRRRA